MYEVSVKNPECEFVVGTVKTHKEAMKLISKALKNRKITPFYYRTWSEDNGKTETVDYGSHIEFFYIKKVEEIHNNV